MRLSWPPQRNCCPCRPEQPLSSWAAGAPEACWQDTLSGAVCQQNTMIVLTGSHVAAACLPAAPLPARRASRLEELRVQATLHLSAMGPLPNLVQTSVGEERLLCTGISDHSWCPVRAWGQQHRAAGTAELLFCSLAGEEGLQTLHTEIGLSLLKRPNTNTVFCS